MSKLHETAAALYNRFYEESTTKVAGGRKYRVWQGKLVDTCKEMGIPYGSYRKTIIALEQLGSIEMIQRGAHGIPTVLILAKEPTEELWAETAASRAAKRPLTKVALSDSLMGRVQELLDSLGGADLGKVLENHETRLTALESKKQGGGKVSGKTTQQRPRSK